MPEQVQKILNRVLEWWKKFNTKQKALLASIAAVIIIALVILAVVVSQPNMVLLVQCDTTSEAGSVKDLLDSDSSITYEMSSDGLTFYVEEDDKATASILLGTNGVPTSSPSIDDVFDGGFSSTEADKTKKYKVYLQQYYAEQLEMLSVVEKASVTLDLPDDDGTILSRNEEAYAAVILSLNGTMEEEQAQGIARYIATQLGNDSTDNITILDSNMNVLFSGGDSDTTVGTASTQLALRQKTENNIKSAVRDVLVGSSVFDHVEVASKLDMNFDQRRETEINYYAPDGQTNGMIYQQSTYESESEGGAAATPGTDSNDDTTYVLEDNEYTSSTISDQSTTYQNDQKVTDVTSAIGTINYDDSSIAIVAKNYILYDEDVLEASGALDDMTFDEYIAANSEPVRIDVDDDYFTLVANATGFPVESISIIAYNEPVFQYSSNDRSLTDYLPILLAVLIFVLLGYVVFRSTRKEKEAEMEPELSVESLLESTKETQESLADIGYNEKSETRILIEKFVEENPEAAASLLRNWLNEDWE